MRSSIIPTTIDIHTACLDALSKTTSDYLTIVDRDGRFVYLNPQCAIAFGAPPDEMLGKTILDLDVPIEVPIQSNLEREMVLATGKPVEGDCYLRDSHGEFQHYRHTYSPILGLDGDVEFVLCRINVTEPATSQRMFAPEFEPTRDAQGYRSFVAESAPVLIVYIDQEQRLRYYNKAFAEWYDLDPDGMIGAHARDIVGEENYQHVRGRVGQALAGIPLEIERPERHRDGSMRYIHASYTPDRDYDGFVRGFTLVIYDITVLKQAQKQQAFLVGLLEQTRILRDPNEVLWQTVNILGDELNVSRCTYAEVDLDSDHVILYRDYCNSVPSIAGNYILSSFGPEVMEPLYVGRTLAIEDTATDPRTAHRHDAVFAPINTRAFVTVPLVKDGRLLAMLTIHQAGAPRRWTDYEIGLLEAAAERTWLTMENARLLRDTEEEIAERRRAESETRAINDRLQLVLEAGDLSWWECDLQTGKVTWSDNHEAVHGLAPDTSTATISRFIKIIHRDDRKYVHDLILQAINRHTGISVEFRVVCHDGDIRWIQGSGRAFYDSEGTPVRMMGLAKNITDRISLQEALNTSYEKERKIATTLQTSYLGTDHHKSFPELEIETLYKAALDEALVGGDFYDVLPLTGNRVAFVVGDVSGKGLDAAARAAEVRFTLRGLLREDTEAASVLKRINAIINASQTLEDTEGFVCLALAILDVRNLTAEIASAGAEPPLLLRRNGHTEELIIPGTPLGVISDYTYQAVPIELQPGDVLLLTTDGLTEARIGKDFLGYEGLTRLAEAARPAGTLKEMGQSIVDGALAFAGGSFRDDVCLLLCKARC